MLGLTVVSTVKGPSDARADRPDGQRDGGYRGRSGAVAVSGGCAPWLAAWCLGTKTQCPWNAHNQWGQRSARLLASANKPNTSLRADEVTMIPKTLAVSAVLAATALLVTGCRATPVPPDETSATSITPDAVKQSVTTFVDRSTAALGGDWTPRGGAGLSPCTTGDGDDGVSWVLIVDRPAADDPQADVDAIEQLWKQRGVTTERYQSGGADPIVGIRGAGGPTASVDLSADPRGYALTAESECAEGDYADMVRRQGDATAG